MEKCRTVRGRLRLPSVFSGADASLVSGAGVDVVGTVLHTTDLRSTCSRSGRMSNIFNAFLTDESGEVLDVAVWGARPSLRTVFSPGRTVVLTDLQLSSFQQQTGVTTCIFGESAGVEHSPSRPHLVAARRSLNEWLKSPQGRVRVPACRSVAVNLTRGIFPTKPLVRPPPSPAHTLRGGVPVANAAATTPARAGETEARAPAAKEVDVVGTISAVAGLLVPVSPRIFARSRHGPAPAWVARYDMSCTNARLFGHGACQKCWHQLSWRSKPALRVPPTPHVTLCVSLDVVCVDDAQHRWNTHIPPAVLWKLLQQALDDVGVNFCCCVWVLLNGHALTPYLCAGLPCRSGNRWRSTRRIDLAHTGQWLRANPGKSATW